MSNYNLPDGYTRLLYIRCTGSQYLNTGFTVNQATDYEATVMPEGEAGYKAVFGARATLNSRRFDLMFCKGFDGTPDEEIYYGYGGGSANYVGTSCLTGEKFTFVKTANSLNVYKSGELLTTLTRSLASFTTPVNMTIGADNTNGTLSNYFVGCIFAITFNWIANYIPCKDGNGVAGLYDTISETFKTSDGDPFLAGPEVHEIDHPLVDSRRRMMMEKMTHSRLLLYEKGRWGLVTILSSNFEERTSELYSDNGGYGLLLMETSFVYAGEQNFTANARITYVSGPADNHSASIRFGYINDSGTFTDIREGGRKNASDAYNEITEGGYSIVSTYTDPTNSQKKACAGRNVVLALRTYFKKWSFDKIEIQIA